MARTVQVLGSRKFPGKGIVTAMFFVALVISCEAANAESSKKTAGKGGPPKGEAAQSDGSKADGTNVTKPAPKPALEKLITGKSPAGEKPGAEAAKQAQEERDRKAKEEYTSKPESERAAVAYAGYLLSRKGLEGELKKVSEKLSSLHPGSRAAEVLKTAAEKLSAAGSDADRAGMVRDLMKSLLNESQADLLAGWHFEDPVLSKIRGTDGEERRKAIDEAKKLSVAAAVTAAGDPCVDVPTADERLNEGQAVAAINDLRRRRGEEGLLAGAAELTQKYGKTRTLYREYARLHAEWADFGQAKKTVEKGLEKFPNDVRLKVMLSQLKDAPAKSSTEFQAAFLEKLRLIFSAVATAEMNCRKPTSSPAAGSGPSGAAPVS